jgi:hypothetical protein
LEIILIILEIILIILEIILIILKIILIILEIIIIFYNNILMKKSMFSNSNSNYLLIIIVLIIILIILILNLVLTNNNSSKCEEKENYVSNKNNLSNQDIVTPNQEIVTVNYPTATIDKDPKSMNALDRIYNPLKYPYKSDYFYDQDWYPNLDLPFQVIGCGSRTQPCLGGTQVPIYNPPTPRNIDNSSISPINISTRGPLGQPQQVGIIYKIIGNNNEVLPLYGRRKYPNGSRYEYYTQMGRFGVKVPVITKNRHDELGSNDVVFIKGMPDVYRVTIYENDDAEYIPYV